MLNQSSNKPCAPSLSPTWVTQLLCIPSPSKSPLNGHGQPSEDEVALSSGVCWDGGAPLFPPARTHWVSQSTSQPFPEQGFLLSCVTHPGTGSTQEVPAPLRTAGGGSQPEPLQGPDLQGEPLHPSLLLLSLFSAAGSARKGHFSLVKKGRI